MGFPFFPPLRPRRGLPELEERTRRGTSSDSRNGRGRDDGVTAFSRPPAPAGDTLRVRERNPRARLMALRGCHGYGEPHGTDATAAPSGKPIYSGKTL